MLLHTTLYFYPEANVRLLTFSIFGTILRNQYKKVAFIRVDKDGALARYYEFMRTCHNMNNIVQNTGGYASSQNEGKRNPK